MLSLLKTNNLLIETNSPIAKFKHKIDKKSNLQYVQAHRMRNNVLVLTHLGKNVREKPASYILIDFYCL